MEHNQDEKEAKRRLGRNLAAKAGSAAAKAGNAATLAAVSAASKAKDSIVSAADANGNGKLDMEDLSHVIHSARDAVAAKKDTWDQQHQTAKSQKELEGLQPVFPEDLPLADNLPAFARRTPMIRIAPPDKRHQNSPQCEGAIGHWETMKGVTLLWLYPGGGYPLPFQFYPTQTETVYYCDPHRPGRYIQMEDLFDQLRKERIAELERIAQSLGASHVELIFGTRKALAKHRVAKLAASADSSGISARGKLRSKANLESNQKAEDKLDIALNDVFRGHRPRKPELCYFQGDSDVEQLIQMRINDGGNTLKRKQYQIKCSHSSGIDQKRAGEIDTVLSGLKLSISGSMSKAAHEESEMYLEYTIEF